MLLEAFYYIVRPIAGKIATKRFPPPLKMTQVAYDGQRDRIHELASVGIFGLFVAADRFDPASGYRFSTYADKWVRKYIQLYCEEIVSVVPRIGEKGDLGRISIMDRIDAALDERRLYRGKAAGGMAIFDAGFFIEGIETDGGKLPDFEYLSTEGPTREYLQRRVGYGGARFVWPKVVSREVMAPWIDESKARPTDEIMLPLVPVPYEHTGPGMALGNAPAEVCYLGKQRPDKQFNSYDKLGVRGLPKPDDFPGIPKYRTPEWRNGLVIAVEYLRRSTLRRENTDERKNQILRRTDAVQTPTGVSRRRGRHRPQAHDEPKRLLPASIAGKVGT